MRQLDILVCLGLVLGACKDTTDDTLGSGGQPERPFQTGDTAAPVDLDEDGYAADRDCDDHDPAVHPGAEEVCDGVDNDCDLFTDEAVTATWYTDADGDGYGDPTTGVEACEAPGKGWTTDGRDCDDAAAAVHPGGQELCDGVDNDCDWDVDEGGGVTWFFDADEDGYGDPGVAREACEQPDGFVDNDLDCADDLPLVNPDGVEACDGLDNDCDGSVDGGDAVDALTFFRDLDGDGYGDPTATAPGCAAPTGYVDNAEDCEDTLADVNPLATEICEDGLDNDCDGTPNGCMPYGDLSVASGDAVFRGHSAGERAAQGDPGISGAGDLNSDGYGDLVIGAVKEKTAGTNAGAVYVINGPVSGEVGLGSADAVFYGEAASHFAGRSVAPIGDVNTDGYDDLMVSAQGEDSVGSSGGAAYVLYGPLSGSGSLASADAKLLAEAAGDLVADVAWVGDANSDGIADALVGAQYNDEGGESAGISYLVLGPIAGESSLGDARARLVGEAAGNEAGNAVWGAGDFDADGYDDLLIGARGADYAGDDSGAVYVVLTPVSGTVELSDAYAIFIGEDAGDELGYGVSVSTAGDVDGDGYADILLGARNHAATAADQGAVYLVLGPATGGVQSLAVAASAKLLGEAAGDFLGDSVHGPGDVDGDGVGDLLMGSGYCDSGTSNGGAAYLVLGPVSGTQGVADAATARLLPEGAEDRLRTHGAGDVDGDGLVDILVGAQLNDVAGTDAGAAYLFLGGAW